MIRGQGESLSTDDMTQSNLREGIIPMLSPVLRSLAFATAITLCYGSLVQAQHVPGTGSKSTTQSDDFETGNWKFNYNMPKSSREQDEQVRGPLAYSSNKKWREGPKRGTPDHVVRVETPPGGLEGSQYALSLKSLHTGIPGRVTYEQQQDDLLINTRPVPVSWSPSCVVRIYLPEWDQWEDRTGSHFGVRADLRTTIKKEEDLPITDPRSRDGGRSNRGGLFGRLFRTAMVDTVEPYWPGMFIQFHSKTDGKFENDSAMIVVRGDHTGNVIPGPHISQPGWWTLGMSFTPDGAVHYYASPGVDDLTSADLITSQYPYGYKAHTFTTMFFNNVNNDDGKTWSTEFIIDDPAIYYAAGSNGRQASSSSNSRR